MRNLTKNFETLRNPFFLIFCFLLLQCSEPTVKEKELAAKVNQEDLIEIELGLSPQVGLSLEGGLNLSTAVSNIVVSLSGCATNYSFNELNIIDGKIRLIRTDKNCVAQLDSFQLDSELYLPKIGSEITNWAAGNSGIYVGQISANELNISITNQITASGASPTDTVSFEFKGLGSQAAPALSSVIIDPAISIGGDIPPNLLMDSGRLMAINSDGSANLDFTLECGDTMTGSSSVDYECSQVLMATEIDYLLVEDTYGASLSVAQADSIFSSNTPILITSFIAPGAADPYSNVLPNGGIYSGTLLTGTTPIFPSSLNYLLIIRRTDGAGKALSYLYFTLSIPDPNGP